MRKAAFHLSAASAAVTFVACTVGVSAVAAALFLDGVDEARCAGVGTVAGLTAWCGLFLTVAFDKLHDALARRRGYDVLGKIYRLLRGVAWVGMIYGSAVLVGWPLVLPGTVPPLGVAIAVICCSTALLADDLVGLFFPH